MAKMDTDAFDMQIKLLSSIAESLVRLADAQEAIAEIMKADLQEQIEQVVADEAEQRAVEIVENKSKRSYIGKRQT